MKILLRPPIRSEADTPRTYSRIVARFEDSRAIVYIHLHINTHSVCLTVTPPRAALHAMYHAPRTRTPRAISALHPHAKINITERTYIGASAHYLCKTATRASRIASRLSRPSTRPSIGLDALDPSNRIESRGGGGSRCSSGRPPPALSVKRQTGASTGRACSLAETLPTLSPCSIRRRCNNCFPIPTVSRLNFKLHFSDPPPPVRAHLGIAGSSQGYARAHTHARTAYLSLRLLHPASRLACCFPYRCGPLHALFRCPFTVSVSLADADLRRRAPLGAHFLFWTRHLSAVVAHIRVPYAYTPPSRASRAHSTLPCLVCFPLCRHVLTTPRVTCFFLPLHPYSTYHLTHTKVYKTRYLYSVRYLPSPKIHDTFVLSFPVRQ